MVWAGVILRRMEAGDPWEYCVQMDAKRGGWELPKGGAKKRKHCPSTVCTDTSLFATARRKLWEEAGVWVAWRPPGTYVWLSEQGDALPDGPAPGENVLLCTDLWPEDDEAPHHPSRAWMSLDQLDKSPDARGAHVRLVRRWETQRWLSAPSAD